MPVSTDSKKIKELLTRGVEEVIDQKSLEKKLKSGKKLRIKLGIDPTSPNLHVGRSIPILKLKDFQELGHKIVLIIGDGTGVIGDTSDKDSERPMMTQKTIKENMKSYAKQAGKILNIKKCEVRYNSSWLKKLGYNEIGEHAQVFSLHEFIARENIKRRLDAGKRISLREVLYPLMQGYDSVAVKSDVELGGTDQRFNLLAGRELQKYFGQQQQDIVMGPLLEGTDGRKMSSSWGNTINLTDKPNDMYGKAMSIPDSLVIKYFELATRVPMEEVKRYEKEIKKNPKEVKMALGEELVRMYHGDKKASEAEAHFVNTFQNKQVPKDIKSFSPSQMDIVSVLVESKLVSSNSEARRAIEQGGVKVNERRVETTEVKVKKGDIVQKGKRHFIKIS